MSETIVSFVNNLTVGEIVNYMMGVIGVFSVLIEFNKKIPFNPLSKILGWIGNKLVEDVDIQLKELSSQQRANNDAIIELDKKVDRKFLEKARDDDEKEAKRLRARIIEFADSCRVGNHHTKTHFENIFRDVDDYNTYCKKHEIPNHFIESEVTYINSVFNECLRENKFV